MAEETGIRGCERGTAYEARARAQMHTTRKRYCNTLFDSFEEALAILTTLTLLSDVPCKISSRFFPHSPGEQANTFLICSVTNCDPRVRWPACPTSGVMRIFVQVGGYFNHEILKLWVAVDLILGGECPSSLSSWIIIYT